MPGRPARPTRPRRAQARTQAGHSDEAPSDPKGELAASRQKSPGAWAEASVERRTVRETGCVSDRVNTRYVAHAAQVQRRRDPPGTIQSAGPERLRRRASTGPLPWQGSAAGTMSPVLSPPPGVQRSRRVIRGAKASGRGRHYGNGKADRSTESDRTRRCVAHQAGATKHTREACCRSQPRHTDRCQATTATGTANPGSAPNPHRTTA